MLGVDGESLSSLTSKLGDFALLMKGLRPRLRGTSMEEIAP